MYTNILKFTFQETGALMITVSIILCLKDLTKNLLCALYFRQQKA